MTRVRAEIVNDALEHLRFIQDYAQRDLSDQLVIDGCLRLSVAIESLARLDDRYREQMFGEAWSHMWGMRNRIAHGHLLVDANIVRRTLHVDIPPIIKSLEAQLGDPPLG